MTVAGTTQPAGAQGDIAGVGQGSSAPADHALVAPIKKTDADLQIVWGEVYAPGQVPDSQNDFMTAVEVQHMAYDFMQRMALHKIDVQHNQEESGSYVVESFIAREDDSVFIPGSWVMGVRIPDPAIWELVKSGELNGFSFDGLGVRTPKTITLNLPEQLTGKTEDNADGHSHEFTVNFGPNGEFVGGHTSPGPDGHVHVIERGTITEKAGRDLHQHRFSFVEGVLDATVAN